jgi:hypothetical protein
MRGALLALVLVFALFAGFAQPALAQDDAESEMSADEGEEAEVGEEEFAEVIVVTGSRAQPRSVVESIVPIDVIKADDFRDQGDTDVSNLLRTLAPSYNVNSQPISDAATVARSHPRTGQRQAAPPRGGHLLARQRRRRRRAGSRHLGDPGDRTPTGRGAA